MQSAAKTPLAELRVLQSPQPASQRQMAPRANDKQQPSGSATLTLVTGLAFIASIVGSLAWPVALFGVMFLFRRAIIARVPGLSVNMGNSK
jgi:hypothetical protein